jgi:hypothetical protein
MMTHYDALLLGGWKMNEIDDMDFLGYIDVLVWRAKRDNAVKIISIDECPLFSLTEAK